MKHDLDDDGGGIFTPRHLDPIACSVPDVYPVSEGYCLWTWACVDCGVRVEYRDLYAPPAPLLRPFCQPCRDIRTGARQPSDSERPAPVEADFRVEPEPVVVAERRPAAVAAGDEMQLELFGGIT